METMRDPLRRLVGAGVAAGAAAMIGSCGGATPESGGAILFEGAPGELLPHETGRTARFVVTAESGGESVSSVLTTRVLGEGPDGAFVVESQSDGGVARRFRARETADEIRVEAVTTGDPDGPDWREVEPPAVLVRTPVVAGESGTTRFVRTVDVLVAIDGDRHARTITFEGESVRTPRGWETVEHSGEETRAIAFEVRGRSLPLLLPGVPSAGGAPLVLEIRGIEHLAPRVGLVREQLELSIGAGGETSRVALRTERLPPRLDAELALAQK